LIAPKNAPSPSSPAPPAASAGLLMPVYHCQ